LQFEEGEIADKLSWYEEKKVNTSSLPHGSFNRLSSLRVTDAAESERMVKKDLCSSHLHHFYLRSFWHYYWRPLRAPEAISCGAFWSARNRLLSLWPSR
jgi:hypothetical protein